MADDDNNIYSTFDSGGGRRGGGSRDFDRRPGNSEQSREYAVRFDPRSEQEFTNRMEAQNQIEEAHILAEWQERNRQARQALNSAQSRVHFFPSVGKFIIPEQNTWAAHSAIVSDDKNNLFFNPEKYVYFDRIVAERFGNRALFDPAHPDYAKYEGLRTNLEVLRNDIIGIYLNDGSFDPGDEKYIPKLIAIATALGDALAGDKWFKRLFTRSVSVDVANVEGVGARELYDYLLNRQEKPGLVNTLKSSIRSFMGGIDCQWDLPPLEETPYSDANLSAPPPRFKSSLTDEELKAACAEINPCDVPGRMAGQAEVLMAVASVLRKPETLPAPTREASVDEARNILRWLRNLRFADQDIETWLDYGTPAEQIAKADALTRLAEIHAGQMHAAIAASPALANDEAIHAAALASGGMALAVSRHALSLLPPDDEAVATLQPLLANAPQEWAMHETRSVARLLDAMEAGLERATKQTAGRTPAERLLEISERIERTAYQLRSVESMEPPAREESIELAREILRRLKNMRFGGKRVKDAIDTGRPEEKVAFARQIEEASDVYANLLAEAAEGNPVILSDPRIKEAGDAVGGFAHAIKLMAAKEIPSSISAAQQISADVTQMPEEWKALHDRAVDRLVTSMEGGLQQAVAEISAQQDQQQDQELAQEEAQDAALLHSDLSRRKKRRKRYSSGGLTKSAKRRTAGDLNGDGVLDRHQGLNLKGADLDAVRQLGGSLRALGEQARTIAPPPPVSFDADGKVIPDDKTFVMREREPKPGQRQQPQI